jgi:hypothetical protein
MNQRFWISATEEDCPSRAKFIDEAAARLRKKYGLKKPNGKRRINYGVPQQEISQPPVPPKVL